MTETTPRGEEELDPFLDMLGLAFTAYGEGRSRCELQVKGELISPRGSLHGGVISTLMDVGMGAAIHSTLAEGEMCATVEMKINFTSSVKSGRLICSSRVIDRRSRIGIVESEIYCGEELVAKGLGTFYIHNKWQ